MVILMFIEKKKSPDITVNHFKRAQTIFASILNLAQAQLNAV